MKTEFKQYREQMLDVMGRYRTASLFWETRKTESNGKKYPPLFTIKDKDHEVDGVVYRSLKAIYFSYDHLPNFEYEFALDVFGSWDHWVWLSSKTQITKYIEDWRKEYDIMLKNKAHQTLIAQAMDKEKGLKAASMIVGDEHKGERKRGRPSKAEQARIQLEEKKVRDTLEEDMDRLGLTLVK